VFIQAERIRVIQKRKNKCKENLLVKRSIINGVYLNQENKMKKE